MSGMSKELVAIKRERLEQGRCPDCGTPGEFTLFKDDPAIKIFVCKRCKDEKEQYKRIKAHEEKQIRRLLEDLEEAKELVNSAFNCTTIGSEFESDIKPIALSIYNLISKIRNSK